ncbi:MAG TPA: rubrerythrin family protein [Coriobacteriia bacterium]|nr:rubrerythrin family protein [Coriobacteriia bacterium]
MEVTLNKETCNALLTLQKAEATDRLVYLRMAKTEKHENHKAMLIEIAEDEAKHYADWRKYTGMDVAPNRLKVFFYSILTVLLGYTFVLRTMERGENKAAAAYAALEGSIPELNAAIADEQRHEEMLIDMLDEERLQYVGAVVLGLNDALVELTGAIAGLTFALTDTRLISLTAIITGIAATLSMAASNYLAEKAEGKPHPLKSASWCGISYLITVAVLVTPYLVLAEDMYLLAFGIMLISCVVIIFAFNFYISVAQKQPLWSRFGQMAAISLGVAAVSFVIGLLAKSVLGVDIT